jgi:site-specific DNA-methyltransferase (adenine-specific)/adenine-specific DNA-methyltransferase
MNSEFRQLVIEKLTRGEDLPREWARELFPPEKREYELVYYGKEREEDIVADTMGVPLQSVRTFGKNGDDWHNMLVFGDNQQVLKRLLEMNKEGKLLNADGTPGVRLVYIDPPFGTGDEYGRSNGETAYSAKKQGASFIEFLRKRLVLLRDLMAVDGSIYVRLDYHFGHYIKVVMDEIFGSENFQNEIVINRFKRQLSGLKKFNISTDMLFFYSRANSPTFNEQIRARLCSFCGQEKEPEWHHMVSSGLRNPPERMIEGRLMYPPRNQHWKYKQTKIDQMELDGRIRINEKISYTDIRGDRVRGAPEFLQTEDVIVDTDWTDLRGYVLSARYPTENAEELLARVIQASSNPGDLILDTFAGSGTTCAVAEKLGRRWIAVDCGKLAVYTMQKRFLNLRAGIGNTGRALKAKPFTLYNAGLYDSSKLRNLPWSDWRFFALQLFECKDEPHKIGGLELDGKRKGASVLVFNHLSNTGKRIDEETIEQIHAHVGKKIGNKFYIIAPSRVFDFQQDYIDIQGVRYYAMRIPYSIINELHNREFSALEQPRDERAVNETVDAVGFDFIQPPAVDWVAGIGARKGELLPKAYLKIKKFRSRARLRNEEVYGGLETLSMLMLDYDYDGEIFDLDTVFYNNELEASDWEARFPPEVLGENAMAVFIDIHGNEAQHLIPRSQFGRAKANGTLAKSRKKSKK